MGELKRRRLRRASAVVALGVVAVLFAVRLFDVQVVNASALNKASHGKRAVPVTITSVRGDIVDRNGNVLATTNELYNVQLSPKNTQLNGKKFDRIDPVTKEAETVTNEQAYREIGKITGQSGEEIKKIVHDALKKDPDSDFAYVKQGVTLQQLNKLKALHVPWLTFASDFSRTYPNGAVAGNLVGFMSKDGKPLAGVELSQNECLTGEDGSETYERSADGVALPGSTVKTKKVKDGGKVTISIDRDMQWQTQQIVNQTKQKSGAEWVMEVIMDAKTGELIAVASDNTVDPNNVQATKRSHRVARAFINPYEPGSSYKTITASAVLDQGTATPTSRKVVPDVFSAPAENVRFSDSFGHAPRNWTLAGVIAYSSNVGTSMFGRAVPAEVRYEYMKKFGLGEPTKAGLPLESGGILHPPSKWSPQTNYTTMFGQGLAATIVQTAGIYQTIANGGVRVPPTLVKTCEKPGKKPQTFDHGKPVTVVKKSTAEQMTRILETTTHVPYIADELTIDGYRIAGKTATAQEPDGKGGYRKDYVHSFAGFFPVENPRYVIVTSVAFPANGGGGEAARLAWRDTAKATIRHFHIPPSTGTFEPYTLEY